jgi:hypothetical protein
MSGRSKSDDRLGSCKSVKRNSGLLSKIDPLRSRSSATGSSESHVGTAMSAEPREA